MSELISSEFGWDISEFGLIQSSAFSDAFSNLFVGELGGVVMSVSWFCVALVRAVPIFVQSIYIYRYINGYWLLTNLMLSLWILVPWIEVFFLILEARIIPDLSGGGGNMLHVWSHSIGTLHMAPLIFLCCPLQA